MSTKLIEDKAGASGTKEKVSSTGKTTSAIGNNIVLSPIIGTRLDFKDLGDRWDRVLESQRTSSEYGLFKIRERVTNLDPIAVKALEVVKETFAANEDELKALITSKGWATELDRVVKRINRARISENKKMILSRCYAAILSSLLDEDTPDEEVKDDAGFVDAVLFELESKDGPIDIFVRAVVDLVGAKNRIQFSEDNSIMRDLIANQVRAGL